MLEKDVNSCQVCWFVCLHATLGNLHSLLVSYLSVGGSQVLFTFVRQLVLGMLGHPRPF